jgi:hypothetical protein
MDGKIYTMRLRDKIIPEDFVMNLARYTAATYKLNKAPTRSEFSEQTKMYLVRLNLVI